jgi:hypothetical protein
MTRLFYHDAYDEAADKKQVHRILVALDAAATQLRKDECGAYGIRGARGHIYTWGDAGRAKYLLYVRCTSKGQWTRIRRALTTSGKCTQDGDQKGIVQFDRLPTPDEAKYIRKVARIRKRQPVSANAYKFRGETDAKAAKATTRI